MTDPPHADFEALSAFLDGEAPEWASHVGACEACRATVAELRAVRTALARPVGRVDAAGRDRAIAAAVGGAGRAPVESAVPTRQPLRWLVPASVAALFAVVVGAVSVMSQGGRSADDVTTAGPALESSAPQADTAIGQGSARSSGNAGASSSATATAGDLGDIADAATLLGRARPGLLTTDGGAAIAPSGASGAPGGASIGGPSPSAGSGASAAAGVVGTRPCEEQARRREPALREVVYFATASRQGVPAFVLGFSTGPAPAPVTLLLLAQDGCGVLLRAAGP